MARYGFTSLQSGPDWAAVPLADGGPVRNVNVTHIAGGVAEMRMNGGDAVPVRPGGGFDREMQASVTALEVRTQPGSDPADLDIYTD